VVCLIVAVCRCRYSAPARHYCVRLDILRLCVLRLNRLRSVLNYAAPPAVLPRLPFVRAYAHVARACWFYDCRRSLYKTRYVLAATVRAPLPSRFYNISAQRAARTVHAVSAVSLPLVGFVIHVLAYAARSVWYAFAVLTLPRTPLLFYAVLVRGYAARFVARGLP